jgi:hypothetical protein
MAAIDFPNSPALNDTFSNAGKNWIYNGYAWTLIGVSTLIDPVLSTTALNGGNAETIQFYVMSAVDGGGT